MKKANVGDIVPIKVNGKEVYTYIDDVGCQRMPLNKIIRYLTHGNKNFDLNEMWRMVDIGMFSLDDARLIYQNNSYTLCGYQEMFPDDVIENPLENKE